MHPIQLLADGTAALFLSCSDIEAHQMSPQDVGLNMLGGGACAQVVHRDMQLHLQSAA